MILYILYTHSKIANLHINIMHTAYIYKHRYYIFINMIHKYDINLSSYTFFHKCTYNAIIHVVHIYRMYRDSIQTCMHTVLSPIKKQSYCRQSKETIILQTVYIHALLCTQTVHIHVCGLSVYTDSLHRQSVYTYMYYCAHRQCTYMHVNCLCTQTVYTDSLCIHTCMYTAYMSVSARPYES